MATVNARRFALALRKARLAAYYATHSTLQTRQNMGMFKKILLIAGAEKEDIVKTAMFGKVTPEVPASVLQLHHDVTVILSKS